MSRRLFRAIAYLLIAGQVLMSAPVVEAATFTSTTATAGMPCADSMPTPDDGKPCPCCPDGVRSMAGCLSSCAASVGAVAAGISVSIVTSSHAVVPFAAQAAPGVAEPPLKPPPIA